MNYFSLPFSGCQKSCLRFEGNEFSALRAANWAEKRTKKGQRFLISAQLYSRSRSARVALQRCPILYVSDLILSFMNHCLTLVHILNDTMTLILANVVSATPDRYTLNGVSFIPMGISNCRHA
jgi:membrane-bound inhibitor of C-type lysozyme